MVNNPALTSIMIAEAGRGPSVHPDLLQFTVPPLLLLEETASFVGSKRSPGLGELLNNAPAHHWWYLGFAQK
jgi:hypothetical protein